MEIITYIFWYTCATVVRLLMLLFELIIYTFIEVMNEFNNQTLKLEW